MIEELDGTLAERVSRAAVECADRDFAMLGLWHAPLRVVAVRAGNPLHWARYEEGYYLASNAGALPGGGAVENRTALSFRIRRRETTVLQYAIDEAVEARAQLA